MAAEVIPCGPYPDYSITLMLFSNVENAAEIRKCVMSGEFEAALLKTAMILEPFQVIVAANRAIHLQRVKKMMTKNVHSEVLFSLSPSKNISDSFRKFGLADNDTSMFVVIVNDTDGATCQAVTSKVKGQLTDIVEVGKYSDLPTIKKIYKISETELSSCSAVEAIVSRISSKEIVTV
ncbi:EKC/KEOPS complex subunit TPRKB-like [Ostrea edulis]|uniref:EKC/KEOPS complex subunit TPRKB-like n=1 Tax=Ostrea edulis TaxID=37623 RepID=UPI0024AF1022|nr:EKC/KEOPS complex subunit TPRKB-like [Ostrea edulis]